MHRLLVFLLLLAANVLFAADKPNIILILADDVGLGDVGCSGGAFKTPNIDRLASGGLRFENCYATPLCGPSRCELLTGRYPFRTGLINNNSHEAVQPGREIMLPTVLKKAGYITASVGKWGQISHGPGEWGFDEYLVFPGSGRYWREQTTRYTVNGTKKNLPEGAYLPDIMHDFVVNFISNHQAQPFFLYYPMSHVHGPIVKTPDSKPGVTADQLYRDNIEYMDKLVGKLVAELEHLKLREKTLVIFVGDNGTARFGVNLAKVNGRAISGAKGTMLEGGSRVPLLVNWPSVTPAGKMSADLIDFSDFFGTCAELAGAALPQGVTLDTHSFAPQVRGEPGSPRQWVYVELNGRAYARDARYKLTKAGTLFDLAEAPFKEIPVANVTNDSAAAASRERLQKVLDTHRAAPGSPNPKKGKKRTRRVEAQAPPDK